MWALLAACSLARSAECPATVDALPSAPWLDRADPRLRGPSLIVVLKEQRSVGLYADGQVRGCWPAALAADYAPGPKRARGDRKTPEGWYRTSSRPTSRFYHAINVHYPSPSDADLALAERRITQADHDALVASARAGTMPSGDTPLGGLILLHGGGSAADWTLGCVALEDADIDALRALVPADLRTDVVLF